MVVQRCSSTSLNSVHDWANIKIRSFINGYIVTFLPILFLFTFIPNHNHNKLKLFIYYQYFFHYVEISHKIFLVWKKIMYIHYLRDKQYWVYFLNFCFLFQLVKNVIFFSHNFILFFMCNIWIFNVCVLFVNFWFI